MAGTRVAYLVERAPRIPVPGNRGAAAAEEANRDARKETGAFECPASAPVRDLLRDPSGRLRGNGCRGHDYHARGRDITEHVRPGRIPCVPRARGPAARHHRPTGL